MWLSVSPGIIAAQTQVDRAMADAGDIQNVFDTLVSQAGGGQGEAQLDTLLAPVDAILVRAAELDTQLRGHVRM